jgi:hypothetical protein
MSSKGNSKEWRYFVLNNLSDTLILIKISDLKPIPSGVIF